MANESDMIVFTFSMAAVRTYAGQPFHMAHAQEYHPRCRPRDAAAPETLPPLLLECGLLDAHRPAVRQARRTRSSGTLRLR
jgi:hypothetical protein